MELRRGSTISSTSSAPLSPTPSSSSSQPINIIKSPTIPYSPLPEYPTPSSRLSFSSAGSYNSRLADGPLRELLPAIDDYPNSAESDDSSLYGQHAGVLGAGGSGSLKGGLGRSPVGRRIVSDPFAKLATSPRSPLGFTSTYLSDGSHSVSHHSTSPRRRSAQFPHPSTASPTSFSPYHPHPHPHSHHPSTSASASPTHSRRRRSLTLSGGPAGATPAASPVRSGAFVGSYEHSLLAGRLSAPPSRPLPFLCALGVLGSADAPARLRCPAHLTAPFDAHFYEPAPTAAPSASGSVPLRRSTGSRESSPWVGAIELDPLFHAQLADPATRHLPRFPGYRVPAAGQVQLVIRNHAPDSGHAALKLFLVPYDVTGLDRGGRGGKTFVRQKSYAVGGEGEGDKDRGRLRYAVHLQFGCPPAGAARNKGKGKGKGKAVDGESAVEPAYYVYSTIRVVFGSKARDAGEKLRVVAEGPDGTIDPDHPRAREYAPYGGASAEWEAARRAAKVARAGRAGGAVAGTQEGEGAMEIEVAEGGLGMDELGMALRGVTAAEEEPGSAFGKRLGRVAEGGRDKGGVGTVPMAPRWGVAGAQVQGGLSISRPASREGGAV